MAVSALLKSAAATRAKIQYSQDAEVANEWESSQQTYEDYLAYSKYLDSSAAKTTDPTSALSYQTKQRSAFRTYTSNEIQRQTDQVLLGNQTNTEKYDKVGSLLEGAIANGDNNLAQNLYSQLLSLSVTIQNEQKVAFDTAQSLAKTNASAQAKGYTDAAEELQSELKNLAVDYKKLGTEEFNQVLQKVVEGQRKNLQALGVDLPAGSSVTLGQLSQGVADAVGQYYNLAADATAISNPELSKQYANKVQDLINGYQKFDTPLGKMDYDQIQSYAQDPTSIVVGYDSEGNPQLKKSSVSGYTVNPDTGKLVPTYTGSTDQVKLDKNQQKELEKLGFSIVGGGTGVRQSANSAQFLGTDKLGAQLNQDLPVYVDKNGDYQIRSGNNLFTITKDAKGLHGVLKKDNVSGFSDVVGGNYGFDPLKNNATSSGVVTRAQQKQAQAQFEQQQRALAESVAKFSSYVPAAAAPPVPQIKTAANVPALGVKPNTGAYTNPATIKPGQQLTAAQMAQAGKAIGDLTKLDTQTALRTYKAISSSAGYGNPYDQYKLSLISNNSGLKYLTSTASGAALGNGGNLKF